MMPGKTRQEDLAYMGLYKEGGVMAARLTDKQKKKIVSDYIMLGSYNATSKVNGVSPNTVKKIVNGNADIAEKCEQKREQNTLEMMAFMESRKVDAQNVVDKYLKALANPEKIEEATLSQIATALGIVVDKFTRNTSSGNDSLNKLDGLLKEFRDAVKPETN